MASRNFEKHGLTYISFNPKIIRPEYTIWDSMRQRCINPKHKAFHNYGGRGITVCDRWLNSFANFYNDMGDRPSKDHSLDRKENDKGYYKENCRWASRVVQSNNTRSNVFLEYNGQRHTIAEWAKIINISMNVLWERLDAGWSVEKSLTKPLSTKGKDRHSFRGYYHTPLGVFESQRQAGSAHDIHSTQIRQRCFSKNEKWNNYFFVPK